MSKGRQKSQLTTPNNNDGNGGMDLNKSVNNALNVSGMLDISGLSAFIPDEGPNRLSVGPPSDLGQSLMPFLSVEQKACEVQCDLLSMKSFSKLEEQIEQLTKQLEERNAFVDELEKKHQSALKNVKESEQVRRLNYDNQILLG